MHQLESEGWVIHGTCSDVACSGIAIAVRSHSPRPAIATADDVKRAVLESGKISYSSGPSGDYLKRLFQRWNISEAIADRTVEAKPGIPVGDVLARGEADLGFQQLSEFLGVDGIDVVGPLPADIQTTTVFTAGVGSRATHPDGAHTFIEYLGASEMQAMNPQFGLEAVKQG